MKLLQKKTLDNLSRVESKIEEVDDALMRNTLLTVYVNDIKNLAHIRKTFITLDRDELGDIITNNKSYKYKEFLEDEKKLPNSINAVFKMINGVFDQKLLWEQDNSKIFLISSTDSNSLLLKGPKNYYSKM